MKRSETILLGKRIDDYKVLSGDDDYKVLSDDDELAMQTFSSITRTQLIMASLS